MQPESADAQALLLLGGSFDPIHHGHLRAALDAAAALGVSQTTLLPAGVPALRDPLSATSAQRLAMLNLAVGKDPSLAIDDCELSRAGATYTSQTLRELRERWPARSIIFLLGADAFSRLTQWTQWRGLLDLAHLGVMTRPGEDLRPPDDEAFLLRRCDDPSSIRERPHGYWCSIPVTPLDISATAIRDLLATNRSPRFLLPDTVLNYIHSHQLYRSSSPVDSTSDAF